jgi:zinc-ribbon domain
MAKHCTNCGHELRETDKFCAECGTPLGGVAAQSIVLEFCTIKLLSEQKLVGRKVWFTAEGTGPYGIRNVASSHKFNNFIPFGWTIPVDAKFKAALAEIIQVLIADGWEQLPDMGPREYNYKFRRPVKSWSRSPFIANIHSLDEESSRPHCEYAKLVLTRALPLANFLSV